MIIKQHNIFGGIDEIDTEEEIKPEEKPKEEEKNTKIIPKENQLNIFDLGA